jgi:hypothetical protein
MKIRAVILDFYKTIVEVGPSPPDASERWASLWKDRLGRPPQLGLAEFAAAGGAAIAREHAAAKAAGVPYPEIYWPAVACEVLPELARLTAEELDEFLYEHAQTQRRIFCAPARWNAGDSRRCLSSPP